MKIKLKENVERVRPQMWRKRREAKSIFTIKGWVGVCCRERRV